MNWVTIEQHSVNIFGGSGVVATKAATYPHCADADYSAASGDRLLKPHGQLLARRVRRKPLFQCVLSYRVRRARDELAVFAEGYGGWRNGDSCHCRSRSAVETQFTSLLFRFVFCLAAFVQRIQRQKLKFAELSARMTRVRNNKNFCRLPVR
jgi:hypothetical protein